MVPQDHRSKVNVPLTHMKASVSGSEPILQASFGSTTVSSTTGSKTSTTSRSCGSITSSTTTIISIRTTANSSTSNTSSTTAGRGPVTCQEFVCGTTGFEPDVSHFETLSESSSLSSQTESNFDRQTNKQTSSRASALHSVAPPPPPPRQQLPALRSGSPGRGVTLLWPQPIAPPPPGAGARRRSSLRCLASGRRCSSGSSAVNFRSVRSKFLNAPRELIGMLHSGTPLRIW